MKHLLFTLLCFLVTTLTAQEYLGNDVDFFQKKARLYQRWLDQHQLGSVLRVDSVHLAKNGYELEMYLQLRAADTDRAAGLYTALQRQYVPSPGETSLEEELFRTFLRFVEVPGEQANMQIYLRTPERTDYNGCFYVWIWQANNQVRTEERINNCRSKTVEIEIPFPSLDFSAGEAGGPVKTQLKPRAIFEKILAFARKKYEVDKEDCEDRQPRVLPAEKMTDYYLEFYVNDLCQEVLVQEKQSLWCDFVELWWGPCNDTRRERLEFQINLHRGEEAYLLRIEITGKFGSGLYRPRASGWINMEPDFEDDFLKPYARDFQEELTRYLSR